MKQYHLETTVYIHTKLYNKNDKRETQHLSHHSSQHLSTRHIIQCVCDTPPTSQLLLKTRQTNHIELPNSCTTHCVLRGPSVPQTETSQTPHLCIPAPPLTPLATVSRVSRHHSLWYNTCLTRQPKPTTTDQKTYNNNMKLILLFKTILL